MGAAGARAVSLALPARLADASGGGAEIALRAADTLSRGGGAEANDSGILAVPESGSAPATEEEAQTATKAEEIATVALRLLGGPEPAGATPEPAGDSSAEEAAAAAKVQAMWRGKSGLRKAGDPPSRSGPPGTVPGPQEKVLAAADSDGNNSLGPGNLLGSRA